MDEISRMLRTGARFVSIYKEDPNVKNLEPSRAGAQFLNVHEVSKTRIFEDVPHGSAIFNNQGRDRFGDGPL